MRLSLIWTLVSTTIAGVMQANDANFEEMILKSDKWSLVDFYADWCRHCKQLEPVYNKVGELFEDVDQVQIVRINGDEDGRKMSRKLKIEGYPMILMYHGTDEPVEYEGARDVESISNFVQSIANVRLPTAEEKAAPSKVLKLNDLNFEQQVLRHPTAKSLVAFTADWCGDCIKLDSILEKLAKGVYHNDFEQIQIVNVVATKEPAEKLMSQFQVQEFPTILFFDPFKVDEDGLKRPEIYSGERQMDLIINFINERTGLHRNAAGRFNEHGGRIAYLDEKLQKDILGKGVEAAIGFLKDIDHYMDISKSSNKQIPNDIVLSTDDTSMLPYYRKLTNKIINGEEDFFKLELNRLYKIVTTNSRSLQDKTVDSMEKRINVLKQFIRN